MNVRTILLIAATVACACAAPAALAVPAEQVVLRQDVTVDDKVIRLGDLFVGADKNAMVAVAYAPAPGRRAIFDSQWLYRVAHAYGLSWRPMSLQDQVTVQRASTSIGRDEIESRLLEALAGSGIGPNAQIELSNRMFRIDVAEGVNARIGVEDMAFDPRSRRFSAVVVATVEGSGVQRFRVAGQAFDVSEIPVVNRNVPAGDVIKEGDIEVLSVRADHLPRNAIVEVDQLIGKSPKRTLHPGRPIIVTEVQAPVLVPKRSLVTIVYQRPRMTLTAKGRAMEDGAEGDVIRITNVQSNTVIEAVVTGPYTVAVNAIDRTLTN
jgi:flagella basal body P-ring formation protein FlgA